MHSEERESASHLLFATVPEVTTLAAGRIPADAFQRVLPDPRVLLLLQGRSHPLTLVERMTWRLALAGARDILGVMRGRYRAEARPVRARRGSIGLSKCRASRRGQGCSNEQWRNTRAQPGRAQLAPDQNVFALGCL